MRIFYKFYFTTTEEKSKLLLVTSPYTGIFHNMANQKIWNNTNSKGDQSQTFIHTWTNYTYQSHISIWLTSLPFHFSPSCLAVATGITVSISSENGSDFHPWPYLEFFFKYKKAVGKSVKLQSLLCAPKITYTTIYRNSPSNLTKHVEMTTHAAK